MNPYFASLGRVFRRRIAAGRSFAPRRVMRSLPHRSLTIESLEERLALSTTYTTVNDWGGGVQGQIAINNDQAAVINNWKVEFDYSRTISNIWDGVIVSHVGTHYVVQSASYNNTIAVGQTITFGFTAGAGSDAPHNIVLDGASITPPAGAARHHHWRCKCHGRKPCHRRWRGLSAYLGQPDPRLQQPSGENRRRQLVWVRDDQLCAARTLDTQLPIDDGSDEAARLQYHPITLF